MGVYLLGSREMYIQLNQKQNLTRVKTMTKEEYNRVYGTYRFELNGPEMDLLIAGLDDSLANRYALYGRRLAGHDDGKPENVLRRIERIRRLISKLNEITPTPAVGIHMSKPPEDE